MATLAFRSALPAFALVAGCFNPDEEGDDAPSTMTASTVGDDTSSTGVTPTTDEDDANDEIDPTEVDTSSDGGDSGDSTTGECTFQGCFCIQDADCGKGLVCRDDTCQPLECGDGMIEGAELCDDSNTVEGDGCDADCTFTELVQVEVSYQKTCVLIEGGRVRCWGFGGNGELGQGDMESLGDDETAAEIDDIMLPDAANAIASGDYHNCALIGALDDAVCWGQGNAGQLGQVATESVGDDEFPSVLPAIDVGGPIAQLHGGGSHTCARLASGTLRCWGGAFSGQLGYGNVNQIGDDETPNSAGNVPVGSATDAVTTGIGHTCAILSNGQVRCWGGAGGGALGYGNTNQIGDDETPESIPALDFGEEAIGISAGLVHTCAVFESGAVRCWGQNGSGELGLAHTMNIGDDEAATTLAPIDLGGTATSVHVGDDHTCAMIDDGSVRCWGLNAQGQLGIGNTGNIGDDEVPSSIPALDFGEGQPNQIDTGGVHSCAILDRRHLRCWGASPNGELGHGTTDTLGDDEALADIPDVPLFPER